jgi:hypothetical protein
MSGASEVADALARKEAIVGPTDRSFGITFAVIFALAGCLPLLGDGGVTWWLLAMSAATAAIALLRPTLLAPLNRWWLKFGLLLHKIVNPVVMGLMFFVVVTPVGLLMRLGGKRALGRIDRQATSYWVLRDPPGPDPQSMRQQF